MQKADRNLVPTTDAAFDPDADRLREECGVFGIFGHPDAAAITALGLHALQHRGQEVHPDLDLNADRLREECGVFGIFGHPDAAAITALGLHALQHRGQEACGIVSFDSKRFHSERRLGLVGDTFSKRDVIDRLPGNSAVGHVRYSTTGETILRNVQPLFAELEGGGFAVAHNGNLTNGLALRKHLVHEGAMMQSTSDTEVILHLVARARRNRFVDRFIDGLRQLEGAYAFVGLTNKKLVGARDPLGIRPLVIGKLDGCPILASETCALDIIGAQYVRDVENGEVVVFDEDGAQSHKPFPPMAARPCIFEYIYFARPDSIVGGRNVYDVRKNLGAELAREASIEADVVVPVPDSGVPAALGYAQTAGIPYEHGIIRKHYVGRTFIKPTQSIRDQGVRLKHSANRAVVSGKRIVLVDDSIVRGTTSRKIVQMMRDAGAKEVHFRISSPPITHPDYYGIDTPDAEKLLAATMDLEGMRKFIGADSLAFLSVDGIYRAMGLPGRDAAKPQFTDHCFTGDYPTALTDLGARETSPRQLSLLAEAI
jgi:amidophosphoribosyltransferase